jgi:hypothetical protein
VATKTSKQHLDPMIELLDASEAFAHPALESPVQQFVPPL